MTDSDSAFLDVPCSGAKVYGRLLRDDKYQLEFKEQDAVFGDGIIKLAYIFSSALFESWAWNNLDERNV